MPSRGKQGRLQSIPNNAPKGPKVPKIGGNNDGSDKKEADDRIPATELDYLGVQLHQAREDANRLRTQLLAREKEIVELRTQLGVANQRILTMEIEDSAKENQSLVKERKFELGRSITKDDKTGEFFWEKARAPAQG